MALSDVEVSYTNEIYESNILWAAYYASLREEQVVPYIDAMLPSLLKRLALHQCFDVIKQEVQYCKPL